MPQETVEAPSIQVPDAPPLSAAAPSARRTKLVLEPLRRYPWAFGAVGLLLISTVLVLWAGTRPGYDPYGWLVWGKLSVHLKLDTNGAPSWKPLPFLFTVPYALVGHYALWLWMITSVAVSLSGPIFAWRIAFWLTTPRRSVVTRRTRQARSRPCCCSESATTRISSSARNRTR